MLERSPKIFKRKRRKRRKKGDNYFTHETQLAILDFQAEVDSEKRKIIFEERIRPALTKLIENIIFVYKFHTIGDLDTMKNDCLSFLFESLNKYDVTRGHKAFSYYNVICRNWFIQKFKIFQKKNFSDVQLDDTLLAELEQSKHRSVVVSYEDGLVNHEFTLLLREEIKSWRDKFDKPQERRVLEAVITLFDDPDIISLYNKKGIYMYLREITGMNTKQVVVNLTKIRKKYDHFRKKYLAGEI